MSDCEGHGQKAVVYKSHFPPLRHSVVTETPANTLANKPRLLQRPSSLFFMPPRHKSQKQNCTNCFNVMLAKTSSFGFV